MNDSLTTNLSISSTKKITLEFKMFLDVLWGIKDKSIVDLEIALLIKAIDSEEQFCHVEFPSKENNKQLSEVWRISDWRVDIERYNKVKIASEINRQKSLLRIEITEQLADALIMLLPEKNKEERLERARFYVGTKNAKIGKMLGIDISEIL